ncbi:P-selectin glycoprotein ligand 1 [Pristis pectinata]|uniref:P-selectin glycoprotein ligand 1 n=1 Tax=Pristis pectinata TaxID=685728 RepID=UPI00223D9317|nr:P-selectin glycoprotein ligand 1 [Pristis pectinata]XP_051887914.1 P-selectin glycoprotein ligand 1 [Pristis pectinata]
MQAMWCSLHVFLVIVSSTVVMGEGTSEKVDISDSTEPTSFVTSLDVQGQSTSKTLEISGSTKPTSVETSAITLQSTRATLKISDSTEPTSVVTSVDVLGQSTRETLEISNATEPTSVGVTQSLSSTVSLPTPSTLYPTSAPIDVTTGSPEHLTSTTGAPTTRTSVYSTMGYLSQTTQDVNSSQQPTTYLIELSASPGLEAVTNASQEPTFTNGSEHWATDDPGNDTDLPEITSFSTPVTNTSEAAVFLGPGINGKTQSPPTSKMTSATKQTPDFHSTTTSATTNTAITSRGNLKSTTPFVHDVTKVTTRNYNRLTTAQAATKKIGLVTQCLIVIAILAGICTIFVICTIVLCTKLSTQRHNYRVNQMNGTELICISALLPEEERKMRKKLRPKRLRDFKETMTGQTSDTDDDDLTLQSFVTEH